MSNTKKAAATSTKAVATKKVAPKAAETKKVDTKKTEIKNAEKKNMVVSMDEVSKLVEAAGIKIANPTAKGNYRIFGGKKGSSLNLQKTKYIIFSTDTDFEAVEGVKDKYTDLILEKGGNSQDKSRPNRGEFTALDTLKALLKVYAVNPANKVVAAK